MPKASDELEFMTIRGLEGVTMIHSFGPVRATGRHVHKSLTLGVVLSGKRSLCIDTETYEAGPGAVLCIGPNVAHTCMDLGPCEYVMFSVPTSLIAALGFTETLPATNCPVIDSPHLFGMLVRLIETVDEHAFIMERQSQIIEILSLVLEKESASADIPQNIAQAVCFMEKNFSENIGLGELARIAELSPCRFNRRFSQVYGMPPHEFHNQIRTQEAKRLIASGSTLAEAAAHCGFNDQSHMNRIFKKLMGMTPGRYAKAFR
ncbi:AraC family transcriptional regulator [Pseudodesulfovibrio sp. zrk46]|uniref:helix-turn-helix domain-containing protein n=1 Tax=Pseudodesulfovibrio sp. zrk46 TaxID=2725288 RepID=UPI0014499048|nr:AraC family transcriptional regulator [Pseudodesulfovibrio sp. zrk46]QJB55771.1 AraC family transcriptional regulator [Pseudodesulfovibrio sp. zrk46]